MSWCTCTRVKGFKQTCAYCKGREDGVSDYIQYDGPGGYGQTFCDNDNRESRGRPRDEPVVHKPEYARIPNQEKVDAETDKAVMLDGVWWPKSQVHCLFGVWEAKIWLLDKKEREAAGVDPRDNDNDPFADLL